MADWFYRTEDIDPSEVLDLFVETQEDRSAVDTLKSRQPVVLVASRGVGKSFLLRVAEAELARDSQHVLPVYVTFRASTLLHTKNSKQFQHWMLARLCNRIVRALNKSGRLVPNTPSLNLLCGGAPNSAGSALDDIERRFESSWKSPGDIVDVSALPTVDEFKDAVEDLCDDCALDRIVVFFDEAAHIFIPEQQRQFFTLFRDLRSPHLNCNAAVYPGVTSYGESFQPIHDATMITLDRDVLDNEYVPHMREIVEKQAGSDVLTAIAKNLKNFSILAYSASGNPRLLLKTLARSSKLASSKVNEVIRDYYRNDVWAEHSGLVDMYPGHRQIIDWGRDFVEGDVLPNLKAKNDAYLNSDKATTGFFWIHRDAPHAVREALRLLSYTGIVTLHAEGMKGTRSEVGTRYAVNLGCLFALEGHPTANAFDIAANLTPKRMAEFGSNHSRYASLAAETPDYEESNSSEILVNQLSKGVEKLDLTDWQKRKLSESGFESLGAILNASEAELQKIHYVGPVRSRRMRNTALAAVFEFLSG